MTNRYRSPNSTITATTGQMWNEATRTERNVNFNHYGIFSNDNTYPVTFNPYVNRPPTRIIENKPINLPPAKQHITKPTIEPPVSLTDSLQYMKNDYAKPPPLLPPYLSKPSKEVMQGATDERNHLQIAYCRPTTSSYTVITH